MEFNYGTCHLFRMGKAKQATVLPEDKTCGSIT